MSFKKSSSKIKSFVTEDEAHDISVKRQEEWERVRKPDDPVECPDVAPRSLFEQLQEQKEKAQQEHDEKYNIKNMFRGIDNDEAAFLELASKQQAEVDRRRFVVTAEVEEYRNEVAQLHAIAPPTTSEEQSVKKKPNSVVQGKRKSQLELLAGSIKTKRKRSEADSSEEEKAEMNKSTTSQDKSPSSVSNEVVKEDISKSEDEESNKQEETSSENEEACTTADMVDSSPMVVRQVGYIPSLGVYSDSSDSESSSSDSDILPSLFSFSSKAK